VSAPRLATRCGDRRNRRAVVRPIFFRNGINLGLPVLICPDADRIDDGDEISLRLDEGAVINHTADERYDADPLPEFLQTLVDRGGLEPYTRAKLGTE